MSSKQKYLAGLLLAGLTLFSLASSPKPGSIVVYCGRSEDLVGPLIERFESESGIAVSVRYGKTAQLAATLLEEGDASPADVFLAQDAGALAALERAEAFGVLPPEFLARVPERFSSPDGKWVGVSGRARVVVYHPDVVKSEELPREVSGFCGERWKGRVGWAPANGSFQAFVTALRQLTGDEATREWLACMRENGVRNYPKNTPIVAAVAAGEIDAGFVNHYYLYRFLKEQGDNFKARNHFLKSGGAGSLVNVAGVGMLRTTKRSDEASRFIEFLLSEEAQNYFSSETREYPLVSGVEADPSLPPLGELATPEMNLNSLYDLDGTLRLIQEAEIL